jgi:hypothetical protein
LAGASVGLPKELKAAKIKTKLRAKHPKIFFKNMHNNTNRQPHPGSNNYEPVIIPVDYNKGFFRFYRRGSSGLL